MRFKLELGEFQEKLTYLQKPLGMLNSKEKAFRKFKFPPEITFVKATIFKIVKLTNNNEIPNTIDIKDQKWSGIYCRAVTACRHNAQTLARKNYKGKQPTRK